MVLAGDKNRKYLTSMIWDGSFRLISISTMYRLNLGLNAYLVNFIKLFKDSITLRDIK